jgi:hypothetical protein
MRPLIAALFLLAIVPMLRAGSIHNGDVALKFDAASGAVDIDWPQGAIRAANLRAEIDGAQLPYKSATSEGSTLRQTWGDAARLERVWKVQPDSSVVASCTITNGSNKPITLGTIDLLNSSGAGAWRIGSPANTAPAAVYIEGSSKLMCSPPAAGEKAFNSTQVLAFANAPAKGVLLIGYLTATTARPDLAAQFKPADGGVSLVAQQRLLGRVLPPGESLQLDALFLNCGDDGYRALEAYGDAVAHASPHPVRTGPTALWCSWYAHRMAVSEDLVLANAAVAAKHFRPLGMEIMQIDHGWQRGDITGDWTPNERFPHGLKWLSDELKTRHDLKLGLWIAPTDVAAPSETFKQHPDWMLKDAAGKPLVNWKWYWKPNPDCFELDATNPAAEKWIADVFANLTASGVSYYKIDFIAASAGEHFVQADPTATRGWTALQRAMHAIRRGAGETAWIRYCQPPPVLSTSLANSAYGGDDTFDAGRADTMRTLRENATSLAAGYWINDRLYHREVCDMSVRMHADVEEVRLRLALMTLAGCSISFSDELRFLPPSRIRLMQQCLPPGAPPMKPLDLFERAIPSIWWQHCKNESGEWEVVGLFNWEDQPQERTIDFAALGIAPDADVAAVEFWEQRFVGVARKQLTMTLPPRTSRIISLRRLTGRPQVIGTDMHLLQGFHELTGAKWDDDASTLSVRSHRMPGIAGQVLVYVPPQYRPRFRFPLNETTPTLTHLQGPMWSHEINFAAADADWSATFEPSQRPPGEDPY